MKFLTTVLALGFLAGGAQAAPVRQAKATQKQEVKQEHALCKEMSSFGVMLDDLMNPKKATSVAKLHDYNKKLQQDFVKIEKTARQAPEVNIDPLRMSYNDLQKAIEGVPATATDMQMHAAIQSQVSAVKTSYQELWTSLRCK
jgi:hypothetical protein